MRANLKEVKNKDNFKYIVTSIHTKHTRCTQL